MPTFKVGDEFTRGKTKIGHHVVGHPDLAIFELIDAITKHDDSSQTRSFNGKARFCNTTNAAILAFLASHGLPVAFRSRHSETGFVTEKCKMLLLEVVTRGYSDGGMNARYPHLKLDGSRLYEFEEPGCEFFLKTTGEEFVTLTGTRVKLCAPPSREKIVGDPWIENPDSTLWRPVDPQAKAFTNGRDCLTRRLNANEVLPVGVTIDDLVQISVTAFKLVSAEFIRFGYRLIDWEIEFGITADGRLVIADVITNDKLCLRSLDFKTEYSKKLFRAGAPMPEIIAAYELIAELVQQFKMKT